MIEHLLSMHEFDLQLCLPTPLPPRHQKKKSEAGQGGGEEMAAGQGSQARVSPRAGRRGFSGRRATLLEFVRA